jgi:hypothetical protein
MSLPPITNLPSVNSSLADSSRVRELFSQPGCLSAEVTAMKKHPNVSLVREAGDDGRDKSVRPRWGSFSSSLGLVQNPRKRYVCHISYFRFPL